MSRYKIEHTFKIGGRYLQIQLYIIENITDFRYGPDLALVRKKEPYTTIPIFYQLQ